MGEDEFNYLVASPADKAVQVREEYGLPQDNLSKDLDLICYKCDVDVLIGQAGRDFLMNSEKPVKIICINCQIEESGSVEEMFKRARPAPGAIEEFLKLMKEAKNE